MRSFFCLILFFQCLPSFSQVENQNLPLDLLKRTRNIRFAGSSATAFVHNDSSYCYLVTVRHLFQQTKIRQVIKGFDTVYVKYDSLLAKSNSPIKVEMLDENIWKTLDATIHYFKIDSCDIDIAILKFDQKVGGASSIYLNDISGFFFGEHCYYAGYPLSLRTPSGREFGYSLPIIKSAIFSGVFTDSIANHEVLLLDGNNTFGLSGSPIFYYDYFKKKWFIAGLVTGYYKQINKVFNSKTGKSESQEENSGVVNSVFSYDVTKLINQVKATSRL